MMNLGDLFGQAFGGRTHPPQDDGRRKLPGAGRRRGRQALGQGGRQPHAIRAVEQAGIVFLDEIDKVCARADVKGCRCQPRRRAARSAAADRGHDGRHQIRPVKTDHILFIASGAFHIAKPSDLLPELQGRLPIRVELRALTEEDFVRILTETDNALTRQYTALMETEGVTVSFSEDGIAALARIATEVNAQVENIGARRLYTVMERVFEDLAFTAPDRAGQSITIDGAFVEQHLGDLARDTDLSRYVL
jgi:ATP-dependent HslUV protease ATP-binding subunit HslU